MLKLQLLRQEDYPLAASLLQESSTWGVRTFLDVDALSILTASNACWLVAITPEGDPVGVAGVHNISWIDRSGELAVGVVKHARGQGNAKILAEMLHTYCFNTLNLYRITSTCLMDSPMAKVAQACGLTLEGQHTHARFKDGEWLDTLSFALLNPREV